MRMGPVSEKRRRRWRRLLGNMRIHIVVLVALMVVVVAVFFLLRMALLKNAQSTGTSLARNYATEERNKLVVFETLLSFGAGSIDAWVEQGVLHVEGEQRGGLHLDWKENQSATVTITVPEGAALRELSVYTSLGDVMLTGGKAGLETGPLTVESDLGSVTLESLSAGESELTLDLGDLTVTGCTFQDTQIENSSGAVTMTDSQVGDLTCALDLGDLTLERVSGKSADWTADLGSLMVQEGTFSGGTVTCDGGEVDLSGALSGTWTVNNSLGGIAFSTTVKDWGYDLTTDLGTIWMNEADQGTRAQRQGGDNQLTATADLGDIRLTVG